MTTSLKQLCPGDRIAARVCKGQSVSCPREDMEPFKKQEMGKGWLYSQRQTCVVAAAKYIFWHQVAKH